MILDREILQKCAAWVPIRVDYDNKRFEGKYCPTQYCSEDLYIDHRNDYDYLEDPEKWIVHELCHFWCNMTFKKYKKECKNYPINAVEAVAFPTQFYNLLWEGHDLDSIKKMKWLSGYFHRYPQEMAIYFLEAFNYYVPGFI